MSGGLTRLFTGTWGRGRVPATYGMSESTHLPSKEISPTIVHDKPRTTEYPSLLHTSNQNSLRPVQQQIMAPRKEKTEKVSANEAVDTILNYLRMIMFHRCPYPLIYRVTNREYIGKQK